MREGYDLDKRQPGCLLLDSQAVEITERDMTTAPASLTVPEITHHRASVNGTTLHYAAAGTTGSPILLVHGFPETWRAFRKLIPLLAASHRVFAVDLRGFGDSDTAPGDYDSTACGRGPAPADRAPRPRPGPPDRAGHQRGDGLPAGRHPPGRRAQPHRHRDGPARLRLGDAGRRRPQRRLAHRGPRRARHSRDAPGRPRARVSRAVRVPVHDRRRGRGHRRRHRRLRPRPTRARTAGAARPASTGRCCGKGPSSRPSPSPPG